MIAHTVVRVVEISPTGAFAAVVFAALGVIVIALTFIYFKD